MKTSDSAPDKPLAKIVSPSFAARQLRFAGNVASAGTTWLVGGKEKRGAIGLTIECPHEERLLQDATSLIGKPVVVDVGKDLTFGGKFRRASTTTRERLEVGTGAEGEATEVSKTVELVLSMKVTLQHSNEMFDAVGDHVGQGLEDVFIRLSQADMFEGPGAQSMAGQ